MRQLLWHPEAPGSLCTGSASTAGWRGLSLQAPKQPYSLEGRRGLWSRPRGKRPGHVSSERTGTELAEGPGGPEESASWIPSVHHHHLYEVAISLSLLFR